MVKKAKSFESIFDSYYRVIRGFHLYKKPDTLKLSGMVMISPS